MMESNNNLKNTKPGVLKTARDSIMCKNSALSVVHPSSNEKPAPQLPLLDRFYALRSRIVHLFVDLSIKSLGLSADCAIQLVILGSGHDSSYARCFSNHSIHIYEVDLPEIIERSEMASNLSHCEKAHDSYVSYIPADLRDIASVHDGLHRANFDWNCPTVFLAECVLCYLDHIYIKALLHSFTKCKSGIFIEFDPISIPDALKADQTGYQSMENPCSYSGMLSNKFAKRGAPVLYCHSSVDSANDFYVSCGWKSSACMNINTCRIKLASYFSANSPLGESRPFDEYASLALLFKYYAVTIACCGAALFVDSNFTADSWNKPIERNNCELRLLWNRIDSLETRLSQVESRLSMSGQSHILLPSFPHIRESTAQDFDDISVLYVKNFEQFSSKYSSVRKFVKSSTKAIYSTEIGKLFWVACNGSSVVGCVALNVKVNDKCDQSIGELSHLCVDPSLRRQGLGKALVSAVIDRCKTLGVTELQLTVIEDLIAARALYASMGFSAHSQSRLKDGCVMIYLKCSIA